MNGKNGGRRRPERLPRLDMNIPHYTGISSLSDSPGSSPSSSDSESDRPCRIDTRCNVYLGSQHDAMDKATLSQYGITNVLTIQLDDLPQKYKLNFTETKFIQMKDCASANIIDKFDEATAYLEECSNRGNTLVHCKMGISRSATICTAFLMKKYGMDFEQAFQTVRGSRPQAGPNFGFLGQLKIYEERVCTKPSPTICESKSIENSEKIPKALAGNAVPYILEDVFENDIFANRYNRNLDELAVTG
jgi:predicted protein tyrosine phosphatase